MRIRNRMAASLTHEKVLGFLVGFLAVMWVLATTTGEVGGGSAVERLATHNAVVAPPERGRER